MGDFAKKTFPDCSPLLRQRMLTPPNFVEKTFAEKAFAEKTFTNSRKTTKFAKVESFPLYSIVAMNLLEP